MAPLSPAGPEPTTTRSKCRFRASGSRALVPSRRAARRIEARASRRRGRRSRSSRRRRRAFVRPSIRIFPCGLMTVCGMKRGGDARAQRRRGTASGPRRREHSAADIRARRSGSSTAARRKRHAAYRKIRRRKEDSARVPVPVRAPHDLGEERAGHEGEDRGRDSPRRTAAAATSSCRGVAAREVSRRVSPPRRGKRERRSPGARNVKEHDPRGLADEPLRGSPARGSAPINDCGTCRKGQKELEDLSYASSHRVSDFDLSSWITVVPLRV